MIKNIRLGYACINTTVGNTSRTARQDTVEAKGDTICKLLALQNLADILRVIEWNETKKIRVFRLSSALYPHIGNETLQAKFPKSAYFRGDIRFAHVALAAIGTLARKYGHRLTFHANPYVQLATPSRDVLRKSLFDIAVHYKTLHAMGFVGPALILHVGGVYGDKPATLARWVARYKKLPATLRGIIMLENDEWHYGVRDVLPACEANGIPMCFDMFHNSISTEVVKLTAALFDRVCRTWTNLQTSFNPKFHMSDQAAGARKGTHGDYVHRLPAEFLTYAAAHPKQTFDVMIEAKQKEKALLRLLR